MKENSDLSVEILSELWWCIGKLLLFLHLASLHPVLMIYSDLEEFFFFNNCDIKVKCLVNICYNCWGVFWHPNFLYHGCLAELNKSYISPFWLSLVISASFNFYMNDFYIRQSTGLTGALNALSFNDWAPDF